MTELERLSLTVETIDRATCVVPRGVSYLTPTGDIQPNAQFRGTLPQRQQQRRQ
jgi:hypothetical protein